MTICQAYTNYDIFNEIELLLKNPYITGATLLRIQYAEICQVGVKPYKNGLKKKIFKPRRGAMVLNIVIYVGWGGRKWEMYHNLL